MQSNELNLLTLSVVIRDISGWISKYKRSKGSKLANSDTKKAVTVSEANYEIYDSFSSPLWKQGGGKGIYKSARTKERKSKKTLTM